MKTPVKVSLDEIMSKRAFSVRQTKSGEALFKITKAPSTWDPEKRSADFVMSTQAVDRYGDIVVTQGVDLTNFLENPVVLFAHNNRGFPIGKWSNVQKITSGRPPRLEGKCTFAAEGDFEQADTAAKLVANGLLRACSIGFMPKAWESRRDEQERWIGIKFNESDLMECSVCSVPAHPDALVKAAGGDEGLALQAIELVLDEWARTPDGLIVPREEYEKAYVATRNKDVTIHEVRSIEEEPTPEVTSDGGPVVNLTFNINANGDEKTISERIKSIFAGIFAGGGAVEEKTTTVDEQVPPVDEAVETKTSGEDETEDTSEGIEKTTTEDDDAAEQAELELRALALDVLAED